MARLGRGSLFLLCLMGGLAFVLLILAALEYRWAGIVSEANQARMQQTLHSALQGMRAEFHDRVIQLHSWAQMVNHEAARSGPKVLFSLERPQVTRPMSEMMTSLYRYEIGDNGRERIRVARGPTYRFAPSGAEDSEVEHSNDFQTIKELIGSLKGIRLSEAIGDRDQVLVWTLSPNAAAIVQMSTMLRAGVKNEYLIAEFNLTQMRRQLFPDLVRQYLGSERADYKIAVLSGINPKAPIYLSERDTALDTYFQADEQTALSSVPPMRQSKNSEPRPSRAILRF